MLLFVCAVCDIDSASRQSSKSADADLFSPRVKKNLRWSEDQINFLYSFLCFFAHNLISSFVGFSVF